MPAMRNKEDAIEMAFAKHRARIHMALDCLDLGDVEAARRVLKAPEYSIVVFDPVVLGGPDG